MHATPQLFRITVHMKVKVDQIRLYFGFSKAKYFYCWIWTDFFLHKCFRHTPWRSMIVVMTMTRWRIIAYYSWTEISPAWNGYFAKLAKSSFGTSYLIIVIVIATRVWVLWVMIIFFLANVSFILHSKRGHEKAVFFSFNYSWITNEDEIFITRRIAAKNTPKYHLEILYCYMLIMKNLKNA